MATLGKTIFAIALFIAPTECFALSDGVIGIHSTGSAHISLTIPEQFSARLATAPGPVPPSTRAAIGPLFWNGDFAIERNNDTELPSVEVALYGSGAGGSFSLQDTTELSRPDIPYTVEIRELSGSSILHVEPGRAVTRAANHPGTNSTSFGEGSVIVRLPKTLNRRHSSARYRGTLAFLIAPQ